MVINKSDGYKWLEIKKSWHKVTLMLVAKKIFLGAY